MKRKSEPMIETCAFNAGHTMSEANKRTVQRFKLYALLEAIEKNLADVKRMNHGANK